MPRNKIIQKCGLDKFYTNPVVAKSCVATLLQHTKNKSLTFVEPSAGSGSFSNLLDCFAYDIAPENSSIEKLDFLNDPIFLAGDICYFGNPPFGNRNSLSRSFIERCLESNNCKVIAFILPQCFEKKAMQSIFPNDFCLGVSEVLPRNSFLLEGESYHVPCVFQIWFKRGYLNLDDLREKQQPTFCDDFTFVSKAEANLFVFGAAPTSTIDPDQVLPNNRGYYVKTFIDTEVFRAKMCSINWKDNAKSSVNGGVAWYPKDEIMKLYKETHDS